MDPASGWQVGVAKSAAGHPLGGADGREAILAVPALRDPIAPPTLNLDTPDPRADGMGLVAFSARPTAMDAMSTGFGFAGVTARLVLRRWLSA
ncbi:beta-ketoacyl-[acyl-carrier-protein] synthase family protein [Ensifer soli]|uniref:hypothetical protein n=1 Tax=Ciceribacter sp. sgz301302 TaxID=3342379 RepID=UPI0035B74537